MTNRDLDADIALLQITELIGSDEITTAAKDALRLTRLVQAHVSSLDNDANPAPTATTGRRH